MNPYITTTKTDGPYPDSLPYLFFLDGMCPAQKGFKTKASAIKAAKKWWRDKRNRKQFAKK